VRRAQTDQTQTSFLPTYCPIAQNLNTLCTALLKAKMARPSAAARNLSLMEELEKLEQSITLTLQGKSDAASQPRAEAFANTMR
jgi:hypothetical protein